MKILMVCNEYPPRPHGGIGTFVQVVARSLVGAGHDVMVVGLGDEDEEHDDQGIRVVTLRQRAVPKVSWLTNRLKLWWYVRRQVRRGGVEIVEVPDFLGLLPFRLGCPVVVRLHLTATAMARHKGQVPRPSNVYFERRQLAVQGNWIGVSQHALDLTLNTFPGLRPRRGRVIYSPIQVADAAPPESVTLPDEFVLYAGFVQARKGAIVLARAATDFLRRFPAVHLVYVGAVLEEQGVGTDQVIRDVLGPELSGRTHFLGYVKRPVVLECMRRARVFAFPSTLEMFPLVPNEAMLQGCPVVVANTGPFPEFVAHDETGLLVDPQDDAGLAREVGRLLADPELARRIGRQGQDAVRRRFTLDGHLAQCVAFYQECLGDRPAAAPVPAPTAAGA